MVLTAGVDSSKSEPTTHRSISQGLVFLATYKTDEAIF
jgi:hypothetical protein